MNVQQFDPNVDKLEELAFSLQPILHELVLIGGCAVGLLVTDKNQTPIRSTIDIDFVTEAVSRSDYYALCDKLNKFGYQPDGAHTCRWRRNELVIDIMSPNEDILGFSNRWYSEVATNSSQCILPSGQKIFHANAPLLLATKLDSFYDRGGGDYMHHDLEDIITLVDGRSELIDEIVHAPSEIRNYIQSEFDDLMSNVDFVNALENHLRPSDQDRLQIVISRIRKIAGI